MSFILILCQVIVAGLCETKKLTASWSLYSWRQFSIDRVSCKALAASADSSYCMTNVRTCYIAWRAILVATVGMVRHRRSLPLFLLAGHGIHSMFIHGHCLWCLYVYVYADEFVDRHLRMSITQLWESLKHIRDLTQISISLWWLCNLLCLSLSHSLDCLL